jgi:hypothetical protein
MYMFIAIYFFLGATCIHTQNTTIFTYVYVPWVYSMEMLRAFKTHQKVVHGNSEIIYLWALFVKCNVK